MKYQYRSSLFSLCALILLLLSAPSGTLSAATTQNPSQYLNGIAPDIQSASLSARTHELCYDNFVVMHSAVSKTPLWSAEHLTRENIFNARKLERHNDFHHEDRLAPDDRAELKDYARSGFDRGHLAPCADMPTEEAQQQCFTLANMIPQDPDNNRHLWEGIESALRNLTIKEGELYIISGPLFLGSNLKRLNGRVLVPTHIYKVVFDPKKNMGAAYLVKNEAGNEWQLISIGALEKMAGINLFPRLSGTAKQKKLALPAPGAHQDFN